MVKDGIIIKGNKEGLNAIIDMNKFRDFQGMFEALINKLTIGKKFYRGATLKITTQLKEINERDLVKLKGVLFDEFSIKDCILEDKKEKKFKMFSGIYEGRTKFYRQTMRSGQIIRYLGNIVIIGDVNPGSEIYAAGNIIVLGNLRGNVHAGNTGNTRAIIAAFNLQPKILQIANIMTRAPEDDEKTYYPEVAKIKDDTIIVEPYLPNKFV